jgi:hypothetical protein
VCLQNIETIVQSNRQQYVKIEEYILLLKIYKIIANKIDNSRTEKLCKRQ